MEGAWTRHLSEQHRRHIHSRVTPAWEIPNQMNTNKTTELSTLGRNLPPDVVDTH
jgi:hypothetical protein